MKSFKFRFNRPLLVLTWKHMKEKRHSICYTILEVFRGIFVFFVLFFIRQIYVVISLSLATKETGHDLDSINQVIFTPDNHLTRYFVNKVINNFNGYKPQNEDVVDPNLFSILRNAKKENDLNYTPGALVTFKNFDGDHFPEYMNYSITFYSVPVVKENRFKILNLFDDFRDDTISSKAEMQWAIDKTFLELKSGRSIEHEVELQTTFSSFPKELRALYRVLIMSTAIAPIPFFLHYCSRLITARRSGLEELMKMVGVSANILRVSYLIDTLFFALIYAALITILLKVTDNPILPNSDCSIVAITIVMYYLSLTPLAFVTSSLSQDNQHADGISLLIYLMFFLLANIWFTGRGHFIFSWILPHAPVYLFWNEVIYLEIKDVGIKWSNIHMHHTPDNISVLVVWFCFVVQMCILMTLAWYLDLVVPGRYGVVRSWKFIFQKQFWSLKKKHVSFHVTVEQIVKIFRDDRYFEKPPKQLKVAVKIVNLSKVFHGFRQPKVVALDKVTLDMYKGEITVFLGANGAGKSTLMSVITGMSAPTSGTVYIHGFDSSKRIKDVKRNLAFCPQHNLTFDYLTVKENIRFFERLRNEKNSQSNTDALMTKLNLIDKADYYSHQLSAGNLRCLQVACALIGEADVLVLDEPSSGMDVRTRHTLWDILLENSENKTILVSTTSLEESLSIGARVALLCEGRIKCHGSPTFLKQAIGSEFNLSITCKHKSQIRPVQEFVQSSIPETTASKIDKKKIIFSLPAKEKELFPHLFDVLEDKSNDMGILAMDVGISLEEIFMRFIDKAEDEHDQWFGSSCYDFHTSRLKGWRLYKQQVLVLMKKNFAFLWTKKYSFMILQILIPVVGLMIITLFSNLRFGAKSSHIQMDHFDADTSFSLPLMAKRTFKIRAPKNKKQSIKAISIKLFDNHTEIRIPFNVDTLAMKAVNIFSNLYGTMYGVITPRIGHKRRFINVEPLEKATQKNMTLIEPKPLGAAMEWAFWVVFAAMLVLAPLLWVCIREYSTGIRYNQIIAGCPPSVHWLAEFSSHICLYMAIVLPTVTLIVFVLEFDETINDINFIGTLIIFLLLFGPAVLLYMYVLSFILMEDYATSQIYISTISLGLLAPLFTLIIEDVVEALPWMLFPIVLVNAVFYTSPVFALSIALYDATVKAFNNAYCKLNIKMCPNLPKNYVGIKPQDCCGTPPRIPLKYFQWPDPIPVSLIMLIFHIIFYWVILMLLQNRIIQTYCDHLINYFYKEPNLTTNDSNVLKEKNAIDELVNCLKNNGHLPELSDSGESPVLIAQNLHKMYTSRSGKCNAVKGISFAVSQGECFGIVGPSGAGKSTTLKMLAGYSVMTRGLAWLDGHFLQTNRPKYLNRIALSSTIEGMEEFLTGYENLMLLCCLLGYNRHDGHRLSMYCIRYMGLHSYSNAELRTYSVGYCRRLSTCYALLNPPAVALADEPSAGADAVTAQLLLRAYAHLLSCGSAIALAEQTMDWRKLESICSRVGIMIDGQLLFLSKASSVRQRLVSGHMARLKLAYWTSVDTALKVQEVVDDEPERQTYQQRVGRLKEDFESQFNYSVLVYEHLSILYYHIKVDKTNLRYSEMFNKLEVLKSFHKDILEDYALTPMTLQELFSALEKS